MSNFVRLDFPKLVPFRARRKYLMWASEVKIYLGRNNLSDTIVPGTECSDQQKERALLYMRRHLNEDFKSEHNLEMDRLVLWQSLKDHFRWDEGGRAASSQVWLGTFVFLKLQLCGCVWFGPTAHSLSTEALWPRSHWWGNDWEDVVYDPAKSAYAPSDASGGKLSRLLGAGLCVITSGEGRAEAQEEPWCQSNSSEGGFQEEKKTESESKV